MNTQAIFKLADNEAKGNKLKQIADPEMFLEGRNRKMRMNARIACDPRGRQAKKQMKEIFN
jgi:hypothetical protein